MYFDCYVVFTDDDGQWWSPFLHKDIKHCYVMIPDGGRWLVHGKSAEYFDLFTCDDHPFKMEDVIVVKAERKYRGQGLLMLNTCVGHAKQILGISNPFILTPYQLFKRIKRIGKANKRIKHEDSKGTKEASTGNSIRATTNNDAR